MHVVDSLKDIDNELILMVRSIIVNQVNNLEDVGNGEPVGSTIVKDLELMINIVLCWSVLLTLWLYILATSGNSYTISGTLYSVSNYITNIPYQNQSNNHQPLLLEQDLTKANRYNNVHEITKTNNDNSNKSKKYYDEYNPYDDNSNKSNEGKWSVSNPNQLNHNRYDLHDNNSNTSDNEDKCSVLHITDKQ